MYLCLTHVDIWQKPTQYFKAIIFQLKINKFLKESIMEEIITFSCTYATFRFLYFVVQNTGN